MAAYPFSRRSYIRAGIGTYESTWIQEDTFVWLVSEGILPEYKRIFGKC